jgi:hypothetical protein
VRARDVRKEYKLEKLTLGRVTGSAVLFLPAISDDPGDGLLLSSPHDNVRRKVEIIVAMKLSAFRGQ